MLKKGLSVALLVFLADQVSKYFMLSIFAASEAGGGVIGFGDSVMGVCLPSNYPAGIFAVENWIEVGPFLYLSSICNYGVSFGMFSGHNDLTKWLLLALALALVGVLLFWLRRVRLGFLGIAIGMIIGGAVGNMFDRLMFGGVFDFLYFHIGEHYWPAFNIADSAIFLGVAGWFFHEIFLAKDIKEAKVADIEIEE